MVLPDQWGFPISISLSLSLSLALVLHRSVLDGGRVWAAQRERDRKSKREREREREGERGRERETDGHACGIGSKGMKLVQYGLSLSP